MTGQNPRFSIPDSTPRSSKTKFVISGIEVYVYGLAQLSQDSGIDVAILYLGHNRTRTYLVTEGVAHEVLDRYRSSSNGKVEAIAVTFNMRNHGSREVSQDANRTWKDGNENHGIDLINLIDGSGDDFELVIKYLPAYIGPFNQIYNIMAGISLGGHMTWRIAATVDDIYAAAIVVGCPNLTALLCDRLDIRVVSNGESLRTDLYYQLTYEELEKHMTDVQKRRMPKALFDNLRIQDKVVQDEFPKSLPLYLMNGREDPLVPTKFTEYWMETRKANATLFVQPNTGHSCTVEMVHSIADWLTRVLPHKHEVDITRTEVRATL